MRKEKEITDPNSCLSKARADEMLFVLLGRDIYAPETIRYWVELRIRNGKNHRTDWQITEALECARLMEHSQILGVKYADAAIRFEDPETRELERHQKTIRIAEWQSARIRDLERQLLRLSAPVRDNPDGRLGATENV